MTSREIVGVVLRILGICVTVTVVMLAAAALDARAAEAHSFIHW
jgi:hypothetical protein